MLYVDQKTGALQVAISDNDDDLPVTWIRGYNRKAISTNTGKGHFAVLRAAMLTDTVVRLSDSDKNCDGSKFNAIWFRYRSDD